MADEFAVSKPHEGLVHELGAVFRPEALDFATDIGQESFRRGRHIDGALAPLGVMRASSLAEP